METRTGSGGPGARPTLRRDRRPEGIPLRRLWVGRALAADLGERAREGAPEEVCGLLLGLRRGPEARVTRAPPCPNLAPPADRRRRFAIDPVEVLRAMRDLRGTEEELLGFYHSHPEGEAEPSPTDRKGMALWPETVWLVIGSERTGPEGRMRAWWVIPREGRSPAESAEVTLEFGAPTRARWRPRSGRRGT